MESCPFPRTPPSTSPSPRKKSFSHTQTIQQNFPHNKPHFSESQTYLITASAVKTPRGFGPPLKKKNKMFTNNPTKKEEEGEDEEEEEDEDEGVIPEIVTNRMLSRVGIAVGVPLFIGLLFFPFFYYLKVGLKVDVPTWVPFIVSFIFFGSALLGVSYGIVSSSWDPMREGSLLGWVEAQRNWPVFWESLWGRRSGRN
ncbi:hypothetical protein GIB67_011726 [Kingdonia uniflora]|uniref:Protein PAM68, chloroplastic n=1 Tax=Kingdonia uniflora TaxID=39325 RepID=A0A7J7LUK9_9MAGN|nr:hypothetical protein GIB67_011726 [Kingdonia uniflora]